MKNFLLACLTFLSFEVLGQNAYYDAIKLRTFIDSLKFPLPKDTLDAAGVRRTQEYFVIINSYYQNNFDRPRQLHSAIGNIRDTNYNPFLAEFMRSGSVLSSSDKTVPKSEFRSSSFLASVGSLNVTNIADGIAQFLIKRGKEELNVAFFNRFKKILDSTVECQVLFPATSRFLGEIDVSQYSEFLQGLREAFHKDLSKLITGLNQLIDLPKYEKLLRNLPEIRLALRSIKIVNELSQSGNGILPDSIIHQLALLNEWKEIDENLGNSWKLLDVISQSIRYVPQKSTINTIVTTTIDTVIKTSGGVADTVVTDHRVTNLDDNTQRCWITLSDMNELIRDPITLKLFLGLVYQRAKGIQFSVSASSVTVQGFMRTNSKQILKVSSLVENFLLLANEVDVTIEEIKNKPNGAGLSSEDLYTYINKAVDIFEYGFRAANIIQPGIVDDRYIVIARNGNDLYKHIYTKNYNNAVMDVFNIVDKIFYDKDEVLNEKIAKLRATITDTARLRTAINALKASIDSVQFPLRKTVVSILKYGNFMASVIRAESGEEVQDALEAAALPAGSYSIKQRSAFNLSVNGYIGYALDFDGVPFKDLYAHGIYAPVGFSASAGSTKKRGPTLTAFLGLIDVGALATYRLDSGPTGELKQEVRLESIFSPSLQLFVELPRCPLALGAGWRRTPRLFYSDDNSFEAVPPKSAFNVSLLVDIPLFTIINQPFEKKSN